MNPQPQDLVSELDEGVRRFGAAVVEHLAPALPANGSSRVLVESTVVQLLDPDELTDEEAAAALIRQPELLASFFQNADLLSRTAESAQRVARVVTLALERAWEG